MRLFMISLAAMSASTACLALLFVYALYVPTRPPIPAWKTTSLAIASDAGWTGVNSALIPSTVSDARQNP